MPNIAVRYFHARALGESIRTLLAYGGENFEDIRYSDDEWTSFKPLTPFGQMPLLEIDGNFYGQSNSVARYLGRKYGLAGSDIEEDFEIDQNVDYLTDLCNICAVAYHEVDPNIKAKFQEKLLKEIAPPMITKLDHIIRKNNGHIALGKLTWGDFVFAEIFDYLKNMLQMPSLEKQYPSFKQVIDAVYSIPNVKAFSDRAPKTDD